MKHETNELFEFIDRAVRSRKYPVATAQGLKVALNLFVGVLNEEEKESMEVFKKNIEQIYSDVSTKHGSAYSAASLAAYKSRVLKVMSDYEKYGVDPTKMATWSPKIVKRGPRKKVAEELNSVVKPGNAESDKSAYNNVRVMQGSNWKVTIESKFKPGERVKTAARELEDAMDDAEVNLLSDEDTNQKEEQG